jgi:hypothetical protein
VKLVKYLKFLLEFFKKFDIFVMPMMCITRISTYFTIGKKLFSGSLVISSSFILVSRLVQYTEYSIANMRIKPMLNLVTF